MVKQLSSLDIHFLLEELNELVGSRADKIHNRGKEEVFIQFFKSGSGKKLLRIISGKALFISSNKDSDSEPSDFCMTLRKHLEGKFLDSISQLEPERILKLSFKSKEETRDLFLEFLGRGNVILCNLDVIQDSLIRHKFKDRSILPKQEYKHPSMEYNLFKSDKKALISLLKKSGKDKIVTSLATEIGLGGTYSEEVCLLSKIDKNKHPKEIIDKEVSQILASIKKILNKKPKTQMIYDAGKSKISGTHSVGKGAIDVTPIDLEVYKDSDKKDFSSFNEALEHYFTKEVKLIEKESPYQQQINELKRIITEQKDSIKEFEKKEKENRTKAEIIYEKYQLLKEIIDEINKAKQKLSLNDIKKKLKGHKIVKDLDVKDKKVVVDV